MDPFFKFTWPKAIIGLVLAIAIYLLSLTVLRGCGIDVYCPQPEHVLLKGLSMLTLAYVVCISVIEVLRRRKKK